LAYCLKRLSKQWLPVLRSWSNFLAANCAPRLSYQPLRTRPNNWLIHAEVTLETPRDPDLASSFLNIRVSDIHAVYAEWSARGAEFLTPPKQHETEIRCYIRDPDGHLIEVGRTTLPGGWRQFLNP
jgi:catechol 2,3-dioxygenase-like lactoylglutathione lyase family enzyme